MPWVVVVAAFSIAFGIGSDRALRTQLGSGLRVLEISAIRLVVR